MVFRKNHRWREPGPRWSSFPPKVFGPEEAKKLGEGMIAYGQKTRKTDFDRDGANVKASAVKMAARLN